MPKFFTAIDKIKPAYDVVDKLILFLCKLLLVVDILITSVSVLGRYTPWIPDPAWTEEIVLSCMAYLAVLSAALAIRKGTHIRMTALDAYLPQKLIVCLDLLADIGVLILAVVMLVVGWQYASEIGSKGSYVSIPALSRFWKYFPIPLAGMAMLIFQLEVIYRHIRKIFVKEEAVNGSK